MSTFLELVWICETIPDLSVNNGSTGQQVPLRSRVEPMYLGAPDLDGIKPVKKFALGLGKDPEEVDGAEGAAPEPLPSLQLSWLFSRPSGGSGAVRQAKL